MQPQQPTPERRVGDRISVDTSRSGGRPRTGEIVEVLGEPGHEHYLVRWEDGGQSFFYPAAHPDETETATEPAAGERAEERMARMPAEGSRSRPGLRAEPGDRLVVHGHHQGEPERDAEILEVRGEDGGPPFLVRWEDSGHEAIFYPGSDAHVEHIPKRRKSAER